MRTPSLEHGGLSMLALTRVVNESVVVDLREWGLGTVEVLIISVRGDRVRVGVEAPREIPVHRREVFDSIERDSAAGESDGR
jgi:carbon storage regulator